MGFEKFFRLFLIFKHWRHIPHKHCRYWRDTDSVESYLNLAVVRIYFVWLLHRFRGGLLFKRRVHFNYKSSCLRNSKYICDKTYQKFNSYLLYQKIQI